MLSLEEMAAGLVSSVEEIVLAPISQKTIVDDIMIAAEAYPERIAVAFADGRVWQYKGISRLLQRKASYKFTTSGTKQYGVANTVMCTDADLRVRVARRIALGATSAKSVFCPADFTYQAMGCETMLSVLMQGGTFLAPGQCLEIDSWVELCDQADCDTLQIAPPKGGVSQLPMTGLAVATRQRKFNHVLLAGAKVTPDAMAQYAEKYGGDVRYCYGATETGMIACASAEDVAHIEGCVGKVAADLTVEIESGQIRVRGPGVVSGYVNSPAQAALKFKDGWCYPGDLGRFEGDLLVVEGRAP